MKRGIGITVFVLILMVGVPIALKWNNYRQTEHVRQFRKERCASRLTDIGEALRGYAAKNGGAFPDKYGDFYRNNVWAHTTPVCPARVDLLMHRVPDEEFFAALDDPSHPANSYIYLGAGRSTKDPAGTIIMLEKLENHEDGINVLYNDGMVKWFTADAATSLMATIKPTTRSTTLPTGKN
jgi:hypothetical protein